jgi:hypothetical protein
MHVTIGLILLSTFVHASKLLNIERSSGNSISGEIEMNSNEYNDGNIDIKDVNSINNNNNNNIHNDNKNQNDEQMPVNDEISLLSKRLQILTEHRQEDYRMLERSLHAYVQKHFHEYINGDIKKELKDLR